jgi:aminoglycoside 3-N-acetyltransferase I
MPFTIQKLGPADVSLAKQLFWFFQVDDGVAEPVIPSDEYLKDLLLKDDFHVIVALQYNIMIGGLTAYELVMYKDEIKEMFLYEIAVFLEYREKGIAGALIEYLKRIAVDRGIKEMYVGTTGDNTAAIKLYHSTGGEAEDGVLWFVYRLTH